MNKRKFIGIELEKKYTNIAKKRIQDVLDNESQMKLMYKVIDLFAGVGGLSLGFKNAGFDIVYANEFDKHIALSYKELDNFEVDTRDINSINIKKD